MEVKARAPGKIILSGEHAVVHGSTAVASSIDLYTYVSLRFPTPSDNDDALRLQLKDVGLEFSWPIGRIKEALSEKDIPNSSVPTSCSIESLRSLAALVDELKIPEAKIGLGAGVLAFLWLYSSIQGYKPATVVITSELPLGSGLGSSAALCVALSAALLSFSDSVNLDLSHQGWLTFGESELELLNKWAFEGEKIIHGKPSGIDNTVATYVIQVDMFVRVQMLTMEYLVSSSVQGKGLTAFDFLPQNSYATGNMIKFKSGSLTRIKTNMTLKMLITNTKVGRNTKALVAGVSERTLRHPEAMASVFSAVDSISTELATIIQSPAPDDLSLTEKESKIEELMEMNQGAGGGGCVLTLLPTLLSGTVVDKVTSELESCGFHCLTAAIGGNGVEICFGDSS
ncbi:unnamed protein product [Prunus armeniaca]|uniref:mevalonate kinase n=1 Tax=Prunus armeniaca TaxID=36596 RepID=A0A6J5VAV6_PRUAR|nr:unnamed protein product [Prunus armeniaca]